MKKILTIVLASFALMSFAQKANNSYASNEQTVIKWIEDRPGPSFQQHRTFPDVPETLWNELGFKDGVPSSMSCFLLKTEGKTILLDTGLGAGFSQLIPKLAEDGIKPEDLKLIYITHMHGDHIGGLLKDGKVVFPNAEVYINRIEAEAWKAMPDNRSAQAKKVLEVYKDHLHLFEAGDMLPGGVKSIAAYGHTPGHTAFQKDKILIIGDLMHGAALQLKYPNYNASFDMDKEAAQEARTRLIKLARENGLTMYGMHLPSPGFVK